MLFVVHLNIIRFSFSFFTGLKAALNFSVSSLEGTAWMTVEFSVHVLLAWLTLLDAWGC